MAINNFIRDVQHQLNLQKEIKGTIKQIQDARTKAKNLFIYKSVLKYVGCDSMELDDAKEFVKNNDIDFKVVSRNGFSEEWELRINDQTYTKKFDVKSK